MPPSPWRTPAIVALWWVAACGRSDPAVFAADESGLSTAADSEHSSGEPDTCDLNADCPDSSICVEATCVCITACDPCTDDEDCPGALRCEQGACRGGRQCSAAEQCAPAQGCIDFECVPNVRCDVNADCDDGQICSAGYCDAGSECTLHSHCPAGMFCQNDDCKEYLGG
ncbi:MAG: hypothetical protein ACE37F_04870 [Nannocystaceae bacterium]|nr:hypothetical protein [bacterium]